MNTEREKCYRALIFDEEDEYADYIASLSEKIAADPADYVSLNNRGVAQFELGELPAALDDLTAACHLAAHDSIPFLNRADVLHNMGDLRGALDIASEAIRIAPMESSCYFVRAGIYRELGDAARADKDTNDGNRYKAV